MKNVGFDALAAIVAPSLTDCPLLADALADARWNDSGLATDHTDALRAAFESCAVVAATDTLRDHQIREREMLDEARRVRATPEATKAYGAPRMGKRPRERDGAGRCLAPCPPRGGIARWSPPIARSPRSVRCTRRGPSPPGRMAPIERALRHAAIPIRYVRGLPHPDGFARDAHGVALAVLPAHPEHGGTADRARARRACVGHWEEAGRHKGPRPHLARPGGLRAPRSRCLKRALGSGRSVQ